MLTGDDVVAKVLAEQNDDILGLGVVNLAAVEPERVQWLWPSRIPLGKLTILEGDPKVGKSTLALEIAARVTTGTPFPDGHRPAAGTVLVLTAEDGLSDTVRPRLDAAGADARRVFAWESVPVFDDEGNLAGMRPPSIPRDIDALEKLITRHRITLVVVDVLNAYLGADVDGHKDQDIRRALMPLAKLAERTGCAIVVLRHLNKSAGGSPLYRGGGSIGIAGAARSILLAAVDPDDENHARSVLVSQGSNLSATAEALAYELTNASAHGCARVRWLGTSEHTNTTLLAASHDDDGALSEAVDFLRDALASGPVSARDVLRQARDAGHYEKTVRRAKQKLAVQSVKSAGMAGGWEWSLPKVARDASKVASLSTVGHLGRLGHVRGDQDFCTVEGGHDLEDGQGGQDSVTGHLRLLGDPDETF